MNRNKPQFGQFDQLPFFVALEQLNYLRQNGFIWFWLSSLSATLLVALLWRKVPHGNLLLFIWYLSILIMTGVRWYICHSLSKAKTATYDQLMERIFRYRLSTLILSTLWGISGIILFYDEPMIMILHIMLILIICVSILITIILSPSEFYLQIAVLLLPFTLMLISIGELRFHLLALLLLAFGGILILISQTANKLLKHLFNTQQSLLEQVHTDPVTQLINRSHFDQTFKNEWRRAARNEQPLALLLIEIDKFQKIEIKSGLNNSDQYLRVITHCLKSVARRGSDILARYGRSEFIALLSDTNEEEAMIIAERLRAAVEQAQLAELENDAELITVSIGTSVCQPYQVQNHTNRGQDDFEQVIYPAMLLSAADRALQKAKRQGGNRVDFELCGGEGVEMTVYQEPS